MLNEQKTNFTFFTVAKFIIMRRLLYVETIQYFRLNN